MKFSLCEILHFIFLQFSAHRAAPLDAPENTIKAIHKAKKAGAKTIHCDLTFTSDGQAFAIRPSQLNELNKGKFFSKVKILSSYSTTFEFFCQKVDLNFLKIKARFKVSQI